MSEKSFLQCKIFPCIPFPKAENDGIHEGGKDVEEVIVQKRSPAEHEEHGKEKDAFRSHFPNCEVEDLREMVRIGENPEQSARSEYLHKYVVVHIRKKPVFDIDVHVKGRIESDAERRVFEEIQKPVFPDLEALGIAESPFKDDRENADDLIPKHCAEYHAADEHGKVENAEKFSVRRFYHGKQDRPRKEHGAPDQKSGSAEGSAHGADLQKGKEIKQVAAAHFRGKIQLRGQEHRQHSPHIVAHAPACDHQVLIDGAVRIEHGKVPIRRCVAEYEKFDDL